jgi:hypothetical protein
MEKEIIDGVYGERDLLKSKPLKIQKRGSFVVI